MIGVWVLLVVSEYYVLAWAPIGLGTLLCHCPGWLCIDFYSQEFALVWDLFLSLYFSLRYSGLEICLEHLLDMSHCTCTTLELDYI